MIYFDKAMTCRVSEHTCESEKHIKVHGVQAHDLLAGEISVHRVYWLEILPKASLQDEQGKNYKTIWGIVFAQL